jgi:hypothetical protein
MYTYPWVYQVVSCEVSVYQIFGTRLPEEIHVELIMYEIFTYPVWAGFNR